MAKVCKTQYSIASPDLVDINRIIARAMVLTLAPMQPLEADHTETQNYGPFPLTEGLPTKGKDLPESLLGDSCLWRSLSLGQVEEERKDAPPPRGSAVRPSSLQLLQRAAATSVSTYENVTLRHGQLSYQTGYQAAIG